MLGLPVEAVRGLKSTMRAAALILVVAASLPAWAGAILDWSIEGGGVVQYEFRGDHHRFTGRGIRVGGLTYGGQSLSLLGGRLGFSLGPFVGSNGDGSMFGPGGKLNIRGCADVNHDGKCGTGDFKGTLLTGSFLDAELVERNGKDVLIAHLISQLNPELAALLNLPNIDYKGELEFVLGNLGGGRWWIRRTVESGHLTMGHTVTESPSFWLLGASIVGLGWLRLRKAILAP